MGGGTFIGKDGAVSRALSLPKDILPSEEELRRDYEAITITHGRGNCSLFQLFDLISSFSR
jgi:hypothetical protein